MINNEIKIKCPDCGKEIKIKVNSITQLEKRVKELEDTLKLLKNTGSDMPDFLKGLFNK